MKKLLLITILFFNGITIAQNADSEKEKITITKGTWSIGGQTSLNIFDNESNNNNITDSANGVSFSLTPDVGYVIKNNLILGLGLGYGYSESENDNSGNSFYRNTFIVSPYIQKFYPINNKLFFTLRGELKYSRSNLKNYSSSFNNSTSNRSNYFAGIRPGVSFFVSKKIALDATFGALGYSRDVSENPSNLSKYSRNNFIFDLNASSVLVGFKYYIM